MTERSLAFRHKSIWSPNFCYFFEQELSQGEGGGHAGIVAWGISKFDRDDISIRDKALPLRQNAKKIMGFLHEQPRSTIPTE